MDSSRPLTRLGTVARHLTATSTATATADGAEEYQPRRILFTGGAGFIGSNVLIHMTRTYPEVFFLCFDNLSEGSNLSNLSPLDGSANFLFVKGDITSESAVRDVMVEHQLDTVMHFAAQTHVDRSFESPLKFTHANVTGTAVLLRISRDVGIKRFLHVSTDEVYGENVDGHIFTESDAFLPGNPYSASKAAAECLVIGYNQSFGSDLQIVTVRPNNIYGPRQYPEKMIPKFILRLLRKQKLPLHGGGHAKRSFLFVEDAAKAFDIVLRRGVPGEAYNIGAKEGSTRTVLEVAQALVPYFGKGLSDLQEYVDVVADRIKNDASYDVQSSKIESLGWKPSVDFDEGLKQTVNWYLQNSQHWKSVEQALQADNSKAVFDAHR